MGGIDLDRGRPLQFTFDGMTVDGFHGDTIASALLAADIAIVGRSFKYHRPRGIWGAGVEEPNAYVDVTLDGQQLTNGRMTTMLARDGMVARSVNASPSAERDRKGFIDRFARFLPAAFYYKTFMWPDWSRYQPAIRKMAGLGRLDVGSARSEPVDQLNHHCDTLIIGAGPSGLAAALRAIAHGETVLLVDDGRLPGGSLRHRDALLDGRHGADWAYGVIEQLRATGGIYLPCATAFGAYDHGTFGVHEDRPDGVRALWRVRARRTILASGAIERPIPFANNDLPGIMSADAALRYLRCYGVLPGRRIVCATTNDSAGEVATALVAAGAEVVLVDARQRSRPLPGVKLLDGSRIVAAHGRRRVSAVTLDDNSRLEADCVLVAGGWVPSIHLFSQAGGRLRWSETDAAFLPCGAENGISVVGAAAGATALSEALAGEAAMNSPSAKTEESSVSTWIPLLPKAGTKGRFWIDLQNDVTSKDVELAVRENFVSVEHLKRYTTLGMAPDQGKTSNLNGLALLAELTGRSPPDVGTTRYRPPFVPIPLSTFRGGRSGILLDPLRRLPLEKIHRAHGAAFGEYGGWLRPSFYGDGNPRERIRREALHARQSAALFDGSPLGKIEIIGPQAGEFLDFVQLAPMASLASGRCRYSLMLSENAVVFDDGIVMRLESDRYLVSCSSAHVQSVLAQLEEWRQDRFDTTRVFIHDATTSLATLTVSGPNARDVVARLGSDIEAALTDLTHLSVGDGRFGNIPLRIARVSFTGDASYELSIRADRSEQLWVALMQAGRDFGIAPIGIEALMILRAEKGYLIAGKDTDGATMPHDVGFSPARSKREFVGRRSLMTEEALREDRRQLVGLSVAEHEPSLASGAHGIEGNGRNARSIGFVTSSYDSPGLGRPIALGLIERGASRHGETIRLRHLGKEREATICAPCAFDPEGARLNG
ncbi:MAG: 2Fe-2S iron-sulfur cluster-binding protein [Mesorhizobium sp.]